MSFVALSLVPMCVVYQPIPKQRSNGHVYETCPYTAMGMVKLTLAD